MTKTYGLNGVINSSMVVTWGDLKLSEQLLLGWLYGEHLQDPNPENGTFYFIPDNYFNTIQFLWDSGIVQAGISGETGRIYAKLNSWALQYIKENL